MVKIGVFDPLGVLDLVSYGSNGKNNPKNGFIGPMAVFIEVLRDRMSHILQNKTLSK